jgi:hypothetical protein
LGAAPFGFKGADFRPFHSQLAHFSSCQKTDKEQAAMAWFCEIRNSDNAVLKRDGRFAARDAAKKTAGREGARKMKASSHQLGKPSVGILPVGQNAQGFSVPRVMRNALEPFEHRAFFEQTPLVHSNCRSDSHPSLFEQLRLK